MLEDVLLDFAVAFNSTSPKMSPCLSAEVSKLNTDEYLMKVV